jgi:hypothetical protein
MRGAVAGGRRVADPELEDAAHRLAAATLSGKVPGVRLLRLAVGLNVMIGPGIAALGIGGLFRDESPLTSLSLILEGALFVILGWFRYVHGPGRQRKTRSAPWSSTSWRLILARDLPATSPGPRPSSSEPPPIDVRPVVLRLTCSTVLPGISEGWPRLMSDLKTPLETGDTLPAG